jgi:hypothetical protein
MRTLCRLIFCGLALISFAVFIVNNLTAFLNNRHAIEFVIDTALVTAGLLALIWLAQRLWQARDLIGRIIFALLIVLAIILIAMIPELQQWALSCLNVLIKQPLVVTVLCLIMCALCCTRPGQQAS